MSQRGWRKRRSRRRAGAASAVDDADRGAALLRPSGGGYRLISFSHRTFDRTEADDRLAIAYRTLCEGAAFVGDAPWRQFGTPIGETDLLGDMVDVRLLGNGLRELDRFLGVLIEEVAARIGSAAHDPRAFARLRNTANKLRLVRAMMELGCPDHRWLRAVGRVRACLHHCGGEMRAPHRSAELSLAGCRIGGGRSRRRIILTSGALEEISRSYRRVGDDLVDEIARWNGAPLDFPHAAGQTEGIILACDGI